MDSTDAIIQSEEQEAQAPSLPVPNNKKVTLSNALIRASHNLTLAEKRLIVLAISKINPNDPPTLHPMTSLTASEYAETYGLDINTAYDQLQAAASKLLSRRIQFFEPSYKRGNKTIKEVTVEMSWLGEILYKRGEGFVDLFWWHRLHSRHLIGLSKHFTPYPLHATTALKSQYSWRLLELLSLFLSKSKPESFAQYSIEDFCKSLDIPPKIAENFAQVRRKVLEPSIAELTQKNNWIIAYTPIKRGRKVTHLSFQFSINAQAKLDL